MGHAEGDAAKVILVVEDEVIVRMDVALSLEAEGYRVIQAANAEEALALLQTQTPVHLVLTDINMPGPIDGLQLATEVRMQLPDVKIVMMSGHINELPSSVDALVAKPFPMDKLLECLDPLLASRSDAIR
jgi:YesN/AraC family two-component response regulator